MLTTRKLQLAALLSSVLFAACSSSVDRGTVNIGTYAVKVIQEGDFEAGDSTKFAIQPTGGTGTIDSVECWFGAETADASTHITATFDAADSDYDCTVAIPKPLPADGKLWVALNIGGGKTEGAILVNE